MSHDAISETNSQLSNSQFPNSFLLAQAAPHSIFDVSKCLRRNSAVTAFVPMSAALHSPFRSSARVSPKSSISLRPATSISLQLLRVTPTRRHYRFPLVAPSRAHKVTNRTFEHTPPPRSALSEHLPSRLVIQEHWQLVRLLDLHRILDVRSRTPDSFAQSIFSADWLSEPSHSIRDRDHHVVVIIDTKISTLRKSQPFFELRFDTLKLHRITLDKETIVYESTQLTLSTTHQCWCPWFVIHEHLSPLFLSVVQSFSHSRRNIRQFSRHRLLTCFLIMLQLSRHLTHSASHTTHRGRIQHRDLP